MPKDPTSHRITANGINHHYLAWGDTDRRPLLLLRATGLCAQPWQPIAASLADEYYVMAFDQRGHGDSDLSGEINTTMQMPKYQRDPTLEIRCET